MKIITRSARIRLYTFRSLVLLGILLMLGFVGQSVNQHFFYILFHELLFLMAGFTAIYLFVAFLYSQSKTTKNKINAFILGCWSVFTSICTGAVFVSLPVLGIPGFFLAMFFARKACVELVNARFVSFTADELEQLTKDQDEELKALLSETKGNDQEGNRPNCADPE